MPLSKHKKKNVLLLIFFCVAITAGFSFSEKKTLVKAHILYCSDGDTCRIIVAKDLWVNSRLAGIDAPEVSHGKNRPGQPFGDYAKKRLNELIRGKEVSLRQTDLDPFNRPIVEIFFRNKNINEMLVTEGLAEAYRGKIKRLDQDRFFNLEQLAKSQKKGIWGLHHYESPKNFRERLKELK